MQSAFKRLERSSAPSGDLRSVRSATAALQAMRTSQWWRRRDRACAQSLSGRLSNQFAIASAATCTIAPPSNTTCAAARTPRLSLRFFFFFFSLSPRFFNFLVQISIGWIRFTDARLAAAWTASASSQSSSSTWSRRPLEKLQSLACFFLTEF